MTASSDLAGPLGDLRGRDVDHARATATPNNPDGDQRADAPRDGLAPAGGGRSGELAAAGCVPASASYRSPSTYWTRPRTMPTPAAAKPKCQLTRCPR